MNYNQIVKLVYDARKFVFDESLRALTREKGGNDYVTAVDEGISNFLKTELFAVCPEIGFVTEEERDHSFSSRYFILDPIDGTTNLVYGYRISSISLALCEEGKITFGVVYQPYTGELFFSILGKGAYFFDAAQGIEPLLSVGVENYTENKLHVNGYTAEKSLIEFGAGSTHKADAPVNFAAAQEVFTKFFDLRRVCSTAITLCHIAAGRLGGYFEKVIKPWDFAAGSLILEEAGGKLSDFAGNALKFDRPTTIVASNGVVHGDLLAVVQKHYGG